MFLEEQTLHGNFLNINVALLQNLLEVKNLQELILLEIAFH